MARVIGIDPGTVSFDLCGLDEGRPFLDESIPTQRVTQQPESLIDRIVDAKPIELVAGPSGYGLPFVSGQDLSDRDLFLAYLPRDAGQEDGIIGLRQLAAGLRAADVPLVFTPGVIHLRTVPRHRKANRIDMGTADKVCAALLAIRDQASHLNLPYEETSFVLAELGGAFTAVLAIEAGRIIDGLGGSSGPLGYRAAGALDGELAYLLGRFPKDVIFSGGATYLAGSPETSPERLGRRTDETAGRARTALIEGVVKAIAAERTLLARPHEILLSGRLARVDWVRSGLEEALSGPVPVRTVRGFARTAKEGAQGAALLADGLAGGVHRDLLEASGVTEAEGTALDHLFVVGAEKLWEAPSG